MKKIGFDIDGVLYPWHMYVWTDLYLRGVIDFEYNYFWKYAWKEYSEGWWYSLVEDESYYFNNPFYDARETINHFKLNLGWDVYAITVRGVKSNNKSLQSGTRWWFNEHKLFVDDIFFSEDKDKIVRNLKLDLFVEDKPESISLDFILIMKTI